MIEAEPPTIQLWVRTDKAQVFGPLSPMSLELLFDNGVIAGRVQLSTDGVNYVFPGRMPGVRMVVPRALWGDVVLPGDELDQQWSIVVSPLPLPGEATPVQPVAVRPGSGVRGVSAGPGARSQAGQRALNASQVTRELLPASAPADPMSVDALFGDLAQPTGAVRAPMASSGSGLRPVGAAPLGPPMVSSGSGLRSVGAAPLAPPVVSSGSGVRVGSAAPAGTGAVGVGGRPGDSGSTTVPGPPVQVSGSGLRAAPASGAPTQSAATKVMAAGLPSSGLLKDVSVKRLYGLCAGSDANALLSLNLSDRSLHIHFKKGAPEFVDSSHEDDSLQAFLLARGLVTAQQLALAAGQQGRFGGELLPALFGLGLLNPGVAYQQLAERATSLLFHALVAEQGSFSLQAADLPPAKSMPLGNKWSLYLEQLRRAPAAEVRRRLASAMDLPVMKSGGVIELRDLKLLPQEARTLTFIDGVRSLTQLVRELPAEADTLLRTAWMLWDLDLVSFGLTPVKDLGAPPGSASAGARPAPAPASTTRPGPPVVTPQKAHVPPPAPARPPAAAAPPPASTRPTIAPPPSVAGQAHAPAVPPAHSIADQVRQLTAIVEKMRSQDYFELFGLKRDADANAIKAAYFKLAKSYHPDTVPAGTPADIARLKADIFALIGHANRTLSETNLKAEYLAELAAGGTGEKINIASLLQAEEFFQKGCILVKVKKFAEAVRQLDDAIKANASEGEYYGWRGWAKFFTFEDKVKGHLEAMRDIDHSLKLNPNAAAVHYFQGYLWKLKGELAKAKACFKRCVELDPRHVDAQRELRTTK